jgi:5-formyltetrahydrofolate cyclo-ligase
MTEENLVVNPEELQKPNNLGKALQEWWDSDACKNLQKDLEEGKQRAVGKYFMLSEEINLIWFKQSVILCVRQKVREPVIVD